MTESVIFLAAVQLPAPDRAAYLDETCRDHPVLRRRVEALLRAHEATDGLPASPVDSAPGAGSDTIPEDTLPELLFGRYELRFPEIASGGMGTVYAARDVDLNRDVAVKVLRAMLWADLQRRPEISRRFIEEAQITSRLQHPGKDNGTEGGGPGC